MGKMKQATRPWEMVSIDLMGPFVRSSKQNTYLFVAYDFFTKFPILIPIRTATARKIVELTENEIFLSQGIPKTLIVDNGTQFKSKLFKELADEYKVKNIFFNCVYHPQNNPTERENKTIGSAIRSYIDDNHKSWDKYLKQIEVALRSATNSVTGYTPFYLNHGREFIQSGTDYILFDLNDTQPDNDIQEKVNAFEQLTNVTNDIILRMQKSYAANKDKYDKNKTHFSFQTGDTVYRRNFALSDASKNFSAKLAPKYIRCIVKEKISDLAYKLQDETGHVAVYHIKDIKHV